MISFPCGICAKPLKVKDELAGKKVKCPGCGQPAVVPALTSTSRPVGGERTVSHSDSPGKKERTPPRKNPGQAATESHSAADDQTALGGGHDKPAPSELWNFLAPAESADEIGRLGPYRVLKVLGAGGMGVVFRAEDPHLQRLVALKAMLPSQAHNPNSKERFFREAKAAASLKHPHIVNIHQVGEDRGAPFLAMEYLEGESLDDRLKRESTMPVAAILRIGREIAEGLEAAHEKGLIHRDIKPANIWLEGPKAHAKILDFGLARSLGETAHLTHSGAIVGTPAFMAPEQAAGKPVDRRCDLFSLGGVLYWMCTGERPFKGGDTMAVLTALALENPPPPDTLNEDVPAELSDLVMQLLAKKREDRPESAKTVADTLRQLQDLTAETASAPAKHKKTKRDGKKRTEAAQRVVGKPTKKWPWIAGAAGLGMVLVAAAVVLFSPAAYGTVRIESNEPDFEMVFDTNGPTVKGTDNAPVKLRAGEHRFLVKRDQTSFEANRFVLEKDQTLTLKLKWLMGKVEILKDGKSMEFHAVAPSATFTNSIDMKLVWIPPGSFIMGSPKEEKEREIDWQGKKGPDETQHKVTLTKGFYLGAYNVTQEQWQDVMGNNPSHFRGEKNLPVEQVSWFDCQDFLRRLSNN